MYIIRSCCGICFISYIYNIQTYFGVDGDAEEIDTYEIIIIEERTHSHGWNKGKKYVV